jgi:hypothetical protein
MAVSEVCENDTAAEDGLVKMYLFAIDSYLEWR